VPFSTKKPYLPSRSVIAELISFLLGKDFIITLTGSNGCFVIESYTVPQGKILFFIPKAVSNKPKILKGKESKSIKDGADAQILAAPAALVTTTPVVEIVFVIVEPVGVFTTRFTSWAVTFIFSTCFSTVFETSFITGFIFSIIGFFVKQSVSVLQMLKPNPFTVIN